MTEFEFLGELSMNPQSMFLCIWLKTFFLSGFLQEATNSYFTGTQKKCPYLG